MDSDHSNHEDMNTSLNTMADNIEHEYVVDDQSDYLDLNRYAIAGQPSASPFPSPEPTFNASSDLVASDGQDTIQPSAPGGNNGQNQAQSAFQGYPDLQHYLWRAAERESALLEAPLEAEQSFEPEELASTQAPLEVEESLEQEEEEEDDDDDDDDEEEEEEDEDEEEAPTTASTDDPSEADAPAVFDSALFERTPFERDGNSIHVPGDNEARMTSTMPSGTRLDNIRSFSSHFDSIEEAKIHLTSPQLTVEIDDDDDDVSIVEEHVEYYASHLFRCLTTLPADLDPLDRAREQKAFAVINRRRPTQADLEARCLSAVARVIQVHRTGSDCPPQSLIGGKIDPLTATQRIKALGDGLLYSKPLAKEFIEGFKTDRLIDQPVRVVRRFKANSKTNRTKKQKLDALKQGSRGNTADDDEDEEEEEEEDDDDA